LVEDIQDNADYVFVPFGSGEIATGISRCLLKKLGKQGMPTVVCVESEDKTNLKGKNLTHDKTLTRYITFGDYLERLSRKCKIEFMTVSEQERDSEYGLLKILGINAEPAAALAFAGARKYDYSSNAANVVVVNTGHGRIYRKKSGLVHLSPAYRVAASVLVGLGLGLASISGANTNYAKLVNELIGIEYSDPDVMGPIIEQRALGDVSCERIHPEVMRKHLLWRRGIDHKKALTVSDLQGMLSTYHGMKSI